jgi:hypothetical protein
MSDETGKTAAPIGMIREWRDVPEGRGHSQTGNNCHVECGFIGSADMGMGTLYGEGRGQRVTVVKWGKY